MHRSWPIALLSLAGCMADNPQSLRPPPDPPVAFPDAEIGRPTARDADAGEPPSPRADVGTTPSGWPSPPDGGPPPTADDATVPAGDDATTPLADDAGVPTYWRDVYPIVVARCAYCHAAAEEDRLAGIPPIVTFAHTRAASANFPGQTIADRMAARVLNSQGGAGDMPQRGSPFANTITMTERRTLVRWVNAGAPEGPQPDGGVAFPDASVTAPDGSAALPWAPLVGPSDAGTPGVRYVDVFANNGDRQTPHRVPGRSTVYNCFVFTVPPNSSPEEFAIEFTPILDQRRHIHHIEVYRQDPAAPIDPVGTSGPADWHLDTWWDCEGRASQEQLVANFVPGQPSPIRLPRGTGYAFHPGDRLMMEIHYDSVPPAGVDDMTGFRITTTTTQAALVNVGEFWVGPLWNYDIAPTTNNTPGRRVEISSECTVTAPVNVFWVRPHMHARGVRQRFWIRRNGSATRTMLAEVDPWDAGNQPLFELQRADQLFQPGDVVGTSCEFVTSARDVRWGSGGVDEMCFMDMIHYPYTFPQSGCFTYCDRDRSRCPVVYPP